MADLNHPNRSQLMQLDRGELQKYQLDRLNDLLAAVLPSNAFYAEKLAGCPQELNSLEQLPELPFSTKDDLIDAAAGTLPSRLTFPQEDYVRFHRTSGTRGFPLPIYDTADDWQWWIETWQYVLDAAGVTAADKAVMAFSFGPFIGFWSAHDALAHRGAMVIPAGGLSTRARIDLISDTDATIVCCTPTYALRMAEVARETNINLVDNNVRTIIVAGEPGGSLPSVRDRIHSSWGAAVIDHSGATEIGPWGVGCDGLSGLHVIESEFIAEFLEPIHPKSNTSAAASPQELVLTSLGRLGQPVIRYRTGDLVVPTYDQRGQPGCNFVWLDGGVLGRADDMLVIRGVNVFPSSLEEIIRSFPEIDEFRVTATRAGELDEISIEAELNDLTAADVVEKIQTRLGLRVDVRDAAPGSLPRYEAKARRFIDKR